MRSFLVFAAGMVLSMVFFGAGVYWFLQNGSGPSIRGAGIEAPATSGNRPRVKLHTNFRVSDGAPKKKDPGRISVFIEGRITAPPLLKKIAEAEHEGALTVRAYLNQAGRGSGNLIPLGADLVDVSFPYYFKFKLAPAKVGALAGLDSFTLVVRAIFCFDRKGASCEAEAYPNLEGSIRVQVSAPGGITKDTQISVPTIILNKHQPRPDPSACAASGGALSGRIVPTPEYVKRHPAAAKFIVIGMPYYSRLPPPPFVSQAWTRESRLTPEELASMGAHGIVYSRALLTEQGRFRLGIPDHARTYHFRLWAIPCDGDVSEELCLRKGFPVALNQILGSEDRPAIPLIGRDFRVGQCGMKEHEFLLHHWTAGSAPAQEAALHLAVPGEVVEGMSY